MFPWLRGWCAQSSTCCQSHGWVSETDLDIWLHAGTFHVSCAPGICGSSDSWLMLCFACQIMSILLHSLFQCFKGSTAVISLLTLRQTFHPSSWSLTCHCVTFLHSEGGKTCFFPFQLMKLIGQLAHCCHPSFPRHLSLYPGYWILGNSSGWHATPCWLYCFQCFSRLSLLTSFFAESSQMRCGITEALTVLTVTGATTLSGQYVLV